MREGKKERKMETRKQKKKRKKVKKKKEKGGLKEVRKEVNNTRMTGNKQKGMYVKLNSKNKFVKI